MKKATMEQKIELVKKLDCSYGMNAEQLMVLVEVSENSGELTEHDCNGKSYLWYSDIDGCQDDIVYCVDDEQFLSEEEFKNLNFYEA